MHFTRWVGGSTEGAQTSQPRATPWEYRNAGVEIKEERFVERARGEGFAVEIGLGGSDALGVERG